MSHRQLDQFVERVMGITPQYIDIFGRGLPGMAGGSAAVSGATNSASDITVQLQHEVVEFARSYTDPEATIADVKSRAERVEALLLAEQTIGTLNSRQTKRLIDEMYDLLDRKREDGVKYN